MFLLLFSAEELECHSTWKDGSLHYLVGRVSHAHATTDEEKFRCFVFEFFNPFVPSEGLRMAQSGDATCNGIFSPTEGSRTLTLKRGELISLITVGESHFFWALMEKGNLGVTGVNLAEW